MNLSKPGEIYDYIVAYKKTHDGNAPTYRQIQMKCDVSSTSMVSFYLDELQVKQLIRRLDNGRIAVIGGRWSIEAQTIPERHQATGGEREP